MFGGKAMTSTDRLLQETCSAAAKDLGVDAISAFTLVDEGGAAHYFITLFPCFGGEKGTLICHADDWLKKNGIAATHGYYCSGLHPDSYSRYDRELWIETFNDWGWRGRREDRPAWCKG
jgi:hypothetical protein